eukprot:622398_1
MYSYSSYGIACVWCVYSRCFITSCPLLFSLFYQYVSFQISCARCTSLMLSAFSMHYSLPFGSCSFHFITSLSSVICPAQCPAFNVIYLCLLCTLSSGIRNNILPMEPMIRRDAPAVISRRFDHLFFHKYFPG